MAGKYRNLVLSPFCHNCNRKVFFFILQLLVSIALTLNIANLHGYVKCKSGTQESLGISTLASSFIFQNIGKVRIFLNRVTY